MSKKEKKQESSLQKQLANQMNSKHKIDARKDIDEVDLNAEKKNANEVSKTDEKTNETKVAKFDEGLKKEALDKKMLLPKFLFGLTFGASSFFPTCSNTALVAGFNITDQFREKMYGFFRPNGFYNWLLYVLWLLPLFASSIITFIITFVAVYFISVSGYGPGILLGASGISIVSVFVYFLVKKIKMPIGKENNEFYTVNNYKKWVPWVCISLAAVVIVSIALIGRFAWNKDLSTGYSLDGYSFANHNQIQGYLNTTNYLPQQQFDTSLALILLASGFFAGFANFVPGLSSGLFLNLFGNYQRTLLSTEIGFGGSVYDTNNQVLNQVNADWAWPNIIVVFAGYAFGLVVNIFFTRWLESKSIRVCQFLCFGFIIGSIPSNFIAISPVDYSVLNNNSGVLGLGLALFFIVAGLTFVTYYLLHRYKVIHLTDKFNCYKKANA